VLLELTRGTMDMSEQTLREKERLINSLPPSPENERLQVEAKMYLALFLAFQNTARAIQFAQEALAVIPDGDLKRRAYLFSALYRAHGMDGDYQKGRDAYVESLRLAHAAGHYGMAANTTMIRAFDLCQYGKLDEATMYCQEIVDAGAHLQPKTFFSAGPAYIGLGGVCLERYRVEEAADYLEQGIQLARQGGLYGLFTGYTQKARLYQAQGQFERAVAELEALEKTLQRREFTLMARHVSLRLAMGDNAAANRLEATLRELLADTTYARRLPLIAVEALKLSLARLALARNNLARAGRLLDEIQTTVEPGGRLGRLLEVHLLRALLLQKQQDGALSAEALAHLQRALELGAQAGMLLLFLEEGPPLVALLQAVASGQAGTTPAGQHARRLLEAFGEDAGPAPPLPVAIPGLLETLTARELEVLQLIAAGHSNRAIADELFIAVRTVKKHASNIYGKLGVGSRTQAVARARELGLLPD
jgi:LuxR family maltose regulon positive regulatory protein